MAPTAMKVHEAAAQTLLDLGVEVVFGLVGDANLYLMNSYRARGGRYVDVAHEASALLAAAGYHAVSGRRGVATVTHGPGLSNAVTSIIEGVKRRTPCVLIAGDTPTGDPENLQDIPQRALVDASGAGFIQTRTAEAVAADVRAALGRTVTDSRPVVLNIPIEFQWRDVEYLPPEPLPLRRHRLRAEPEAIERAIGVIASAKRPIVLAGRGGIDAKDALLRLADRLGAAVATTVQARQLFAGHPLDLGIMGTLTSSPAALDAIAGADCIIAFGASLNKRTTAEGSLTAGPAVIHVDEEAAALGAWVPPTVAIHGDSALVADDLVALLDEAELGGGSPWGPDLAVRLAQERTDADARALALIDRELEREREGTRAAGTLQLDLAFAALERGFPADRNLVIDSGRLCKTALAVMTVEDPRHYVHTINFGAIGVGLPYAIGVALGAPERPTLLVCGDGGFMLGGLTEFSTAVRNQLDLVVVVINDGAFGAEHVQLHARGLDPSISMFDWPDLAPVAEALGGRGITVRTIAELDRALAELESRDGPVLIDVKVDPAEISAA